MMYAKVSGFRHSRARSISIHICPQYSIIYSRYCVYSIHCYWDMMFSSRTLMLSGSTRIGIRWSSFKTSRPTLVTLMSFSNMMGLIASDMLPTLPILDFSTHAPTNEHNICSRRCCIIPIWSSRGILNSRHSSNCLQNIVHYSVSMSKFWGVALKCSQVRGSACPACHCQRHPLIADFTARCFLSSHYPHTRRISLSSKWCFHEKVCEKGNKIIRLPHVSVFQRNLVFNNLPQH